MIHPILFTGHMIDRADRKEPRFPADKEMGVRRAIFTTLAKEQLSSPALKGIAGGACGGDMLFHEVCLELGIPSEIYLAFEPEEFKKHSVSFAGPDWEERFDRLIDRLPFHVLPTRNSQDNVWAATNRWMLDTALDIGSQQTTLMALWDEKKADGPGGTQDMIDTAKNKGAKTLVLRIQDI
ncbi:hypothetical protein [Flavobacterium sp.]|uniref:hypothetical protein n=1 Tax=Flavobacterium sp. TaxID=239 RepID=UPI0039E719D5